MEDRKIGVILDDLLQSCIDSLSAADKISKGKTYKALDAASKSAFIKCQNELLKTSENSEKERDNCLNEKSKDLNKMKAALTKQLTALDNLEEINGRMHVLEDADVEKNLAEFLTATKTLKNLEADLKKLETSFDSVLKKLKKAEVAAKDSSLKAIFGGGIGAIALCLTPFGPGIALSAATVVFVSNTAVGQVLNGNEPSTVKQGTSLASAAGPLAKLFKSTPKSFGPVLYVATTTVNIGEAFSNVNEAVQLKKEIKSLLASIKSLTPKFEKAFATFATWGDATQKTISTALAGVRSFKPKKGAFHKLPSMLK
ncbi:hypothetical protein Z946_3714 [Sulfitobacter noctilucicola]|nr:hypothetical protein Z946_3714 [Sulfitobacter noctilucicola]